MSRDSHNRSGSIGHQYIIRYPYGNFLVVYGINRECSGKHTGFVFFKCAALQLRLPASRGLVFMNGIPLRFRHDGIQQGVFRGHDHIGGTKQGVRSGRKHLDLVRFSAFR